MLETSLAGRAPWSDVSLTYYRMYCKVTHAMVGQHGPARRDYHSQISHVGGQPMRRAAGLQGCRHIAEMLSTHLCTSRQRTVHEGKPCARPWHAHFALATLHALSGNPLGCGELCSRPIYSDIPFLAWYPRVRHCSVAG